MHALISTEWGSAAQRPLNKPETSLQPENIKILNMEILEHCCLITLFLSCLFMSPGFPRLIERKKYKGNIKNKVQWGSALFLSFQKSDKKAFEKEGRPVSWRHDGRRSGWHGNLAGRQSIENTTMKRDREPGQSSDTSSRIRSPDLRHTTVLCYRQKPK